MDSKAQRRAAWQDYWTRGALQSRGGAPGYIGAIRDYWMGALAPLPADSRVLNLGCGNGALERLFRDAPGPRFVGVDLAEVGPEWLDGLSPQARARFEFHGGTDMEALPLEAASVDAVVSQYGLEYARPEPAWAEIRRVARPGARLALLLHHADSLLARSAAGEAEQGRYLLRESALLEAAAALVPFLAMAANPAGRERLGRDPQAARLRERYNEAQAAARAWQGGQGAGGLLEDVATGVHQSLGAIGRLGRDAVERHLAVVRERIEHAVLRQRELTAVALDEAAFAALCAQVESWGGRVDRREPLYEGDSLLGWVLEGALP